MSMSPFRNLPTQVSSGHESSNYHMCRSTAYQAFFRDVSVFDLLSCLGSSNYYYHSTDEKLEACGRQNNDTKDIHILILRT